MASRLRNTPTTRYITTMQLVQFATSFALTIAFKWYSYDGRECIGSQTGPFEFTLLANISFFVSFTRLFYVFSTIKGAVSDLR